MKYKIFLLAVIATTGVSAQKITSEKVTAMTTTSQSDIQTTTPSGQTEIATLGAGCFVKWDWRLHCVASDSLVL